MLGNIKSNYITRIVFSFIDLKETYKLVKSNQKLLKKLEINSLYFKQLSGKYLIREKMEK